MSRAKVKAWSSKYVDWLEKCKATVSIPWLYHKLLGVFLLQIFFILASKKIIQNWIQSQLSCNLTSNQQIFQKWITCFYTIHVTQWSHSIHELCYDMKMQNIGTILHKEKNLRNKILGIPGILKISFKFYFFCTWEDSVRQTSKKLRFFSWSGNKLMSPSLPFIADLLLQWNEGLKTKVM